MKKSLSLLVLSILLLGILVSAQTEGTTPTPTTTTETSKETSPLIKLNPKDPTPKLDEKLEREISIPQGFHTLARFGLGINPNEKIEVSNLITIIALWVLILIISLSATKSIPSLNQTTSWIVAICFTLLVSSSKGLAIATENWLSNEELFIFIDGWSFGNLVINLIAISLTLVLALYIKNVIKNEIQSDKENTAVENIKAWFSSFRKND